MKKSRKKLFSAIAALAICAIAIGASTVKPEVIKDVAVGRKIVAVDTALGVRATQTGKVYYASAEAKAFGNTTGTMENPFHIGDILSGSTISGITLEAGDTLYVLPGHYDLGAKITMARDKVIGQYNKYIRVINAALDSASGYVGNEDKVTLDFSTMPFDSVNRGVSIDTDYIYWYGIDVCGAGDNGLYIGGSYNTIEYCEFYNNRDSGLQLGRSFSEYNSVYQWPSYNLVKDCTSHNNYDNETFGENADGFAAKLTVGFGNVFDGCVAYRNSDDGWDLYAKTDSGNIGAVIIYNCVAFENGYLEYTRDECNSLYPTYNKEMAYHTGENTENKYMTRDGDGNGFKLGGSIMEGDVLLYNCLSFNNRMHGVTDNSNPGYIKSTFVTSYNNSAMVDENGNIAALPNDNDDVHSNIDVSRQIYSYNALCNVLSVRNASMVKSLDADNYRGTVVNSLLDAKGKTNVIKGSIEGDTINEKQKFTSQVEALDYASMFAKVPNDSSDPDTLRGNENSMNIVIEEVEGKSVGKVGSLKNTRVHVKYRNADHSINMGDVLDKTQAGEEYISSQLGAGVTAGSDLNLTSWTDYKHFYQDDLVNGAADSADKALVERARDSITLNTVEEAVYQDFEVPVKLFNATVEWSVDNAEFAKVKDGKDDIIVSSSGTEYAVVEIYRDKDEDKSFTLTATVKSGEATASKSFTLTIKQGTPTVGTVFAESADGSIISNGERIIIDQYAVYTEPVVKAKNGLYPDSNKLLKASDYDVTSTYTYQINANEHAVEVKGFTPSASGVFTISHSVNIKGQTSVVGKMSYKVFIANKNADVAFTGEAKVVANRGGFSISGAPSSATGILYALSSTTERTDVTADNIKTQNGVAFNEFRDTHIGFNFKNANTDSYFVYYAIANVNGKITSPLYSAKINKVDIDDTQKFVTIASGSKIGDENPAQTVYTLTKDLDFTGVTFAAGTDAFTGVFNGMGFTLANIKSAKGIFNRVDGGTIMNVKISNMTINASGEKIGFVTECTGGDFYNIAFTNVAISGAGSRVGVLIGHVGDNSRTGSDVTISQVSIVNDADHKVVGSTRVAGLIGYVQAYEHKISIDNCYVVTDIEASTKGEGGGMVASWEDRAGDTLIISQCYYAGQLKTAVAPGSSRLGGMLGYHKGGLGVLEISRCISLAKFHIQGAEREMSLKNASPILGNFSSSMKTVVSVKYCIGLIQEYNTSYDVQVFSANDLKRHDSYLTGADYLNLDESRWTIVKADEGNTKDLYKAPFVILNFLAVS